MEHNDFLAFDFAKSIGRLVKGRMDNMLNELLVG
jgi:hypothetical protein